MLETLLSGSGSPEEPVAISPCGIRTRGELLRAARVVTDRAQGGGPWLLTGEDAFSFAAGLLGLLSAGASVVLPPNLLPGTRNQFRPECRGEITGIPSQSERGLTGSIPDGLILFWTSGSSGSPKRVERRFSELMAEVEILERLFGSRFQGGPVLGTVPHHHIYGCLFRVLWPLATGRVFFTEPCGAPDRFSHFLGRADAPALVSSPAHLSRLPGLLDLNRFQQPPAVIFSSGGPLKPEDALLWRRWVPEGIVEIYGSTESGGIAWRIQDGQPGSTAWTPFPDVGLDTTLDQALFIDTPRVTGGSLRMEDTAIIQPDGRFLLRGRLDRVVKVEETRVSLPEIEAALTDHPWVQEAAALLLESPRRMIGAAIVLRPNTPAASPTSLATALRTHLGDRFDPVAIPKRWRFIPELPRSDRGKIENASLLKLFQPGGAP